MSQEVTVDEHEFRKCLKYCGECHDRRFFGKVENAQDENANEDNKDGKDGKKGKKKGKDGKKAPDSDSSDDSDRSSDSDSDSDDSEAGVSEEEEEERICDIDNCNVTDEEKDLLKKHWAWMQQYMRRKGKDEMMAMIDRNVTIGPQNALKDWIAKDANDRWGNDIVVIPRDSEEVSKKFCRMVADFYHIDVPTTLREVVTLTSRKDEDGDPHKNKLFRFFIDLEILGIQERALDGLYDFMTDGYQKGPLAAIAEQLHIL
jgi:hypothetical protein